MVQLSYMNNGVTAGGLRVVKPENRQLENMQWYHGGIIVKQVLVQPEIGQCSNNQKWAVQTEEKNVAESQVVVTEQTTEQTSVNMGNQPRVEFHNKREKKTYCD